MLRLHPVPDLIQLGKIDITKPFAMRMQLVLEPSEARDKLVRRGLQRALGIEFAFARQIDHGKQQIADLILDRLFAFRTNPSCGGSILRGNRRLGFGDFFFDFRDHVAQFCPIEIDPGRF